MRLKTSRAVVDYWNEVRGNRPVPTRAALKPGPISALLPDLFILQWNEHGDLEFRLAGTRVCTLLGQELRGQSFTALWPSVHRANMSSLLTSCVEQHICLCLNVAGCRSDYQPVRFEMVLLPLDDDEAGASRIVGSLVPESSATWQLLEPIESLLLEGMQIIGSESSASPIPVMAEFRRKDPGLVAALRSFVPFGKKRFSQHSA